MKFLKIIVPCLLLGLASCSDDASPNDQDCPTELLCTEQFVSLTFSPRVNGEFVELDSYYTQNLDNGTAYIFDSDHNLPISEFYIVISDAQLNDIDKEGTTLRFFGTKDNQLVIEQDFIVGHDCCHVIPLEGPFGNL